MWYGFKGLCYRRKSRYIYIYIYMYFSTAISQDWIKVSKIKQNCNSRQ